MESITLELRPRLRSLNAYMSLKESIDASAVKVKLLEDTIEIEIGEKLFILPLTNVRLLPTSLSSLGITNRWISFRIQTQPHAIYGTFETELIETDNALNDVSLTCKNTTGLPPKNVECKLLCVCCKHEITKSICFQRVLPLPSSDCDPQEWFCCDHSGNESFSLDPKGSDLFYSINYYVLNKSIFIGELKLRNYLVHCNRCLSVLGSTNKENSKSLRIWNCCVEFESFGSDSFFNKTSPLDDFLCSIKHTAELVIGEKVLLEAQDTNSIHYVLLRPMEAKLNLLTNEKPTSNASTLKLESSFVVKVLYKYGESRKTSRSNDTDIKYCELALPSILAGMDQLVTSSARFPPAYRKAEDFYIGYLRL
ncbi:hypothetical protein QAD02_014490 [Eretmocerus hayati]|uniref:Uncharacterized protein n=1 Tax=Eretmocerus hayati TaxID=131215 RepID=A0ACC2P6H1_9HYME|nr:hypothetical protein QAD02_014490 [Eretmocerus hayati]